MSDVIEPIPFTPELAEHADLEVFAARGGVLAYDAQQTDEFLHAVELGAYDAAERVAAVTGQRPLPYPPTVIMRARFDVLDAKHGHTGYRKDQVDAFLGYLGEIAGILTAQIDDRRGTVPTQEAPTQEVELRLATALQSNQFLRGRIAELTASR